MPEYDIIVSKQIVYTQYNCYMQWSCILNCNRQYWLKMQHDTEIYYLLHENLAFAVPVTSDGNESMETGTVPSFPTKKEEQ